MHRRTQLTNCIKAEARVLGVWFAATAPPTDGWKQVPLNERLKRYFSKQVTLLMLYYNTAFNYKIKLLNEGVYALFSNSFIDGIHSFQEVAAKF